MRAVVSLFLASLVVAFGAAPAAATPPPPAGHAPHGSDRSGLREARAARSGVVKWPRSTLTYAHKTPWDAEVRRAVRWWNRAPGNLRFVRTSWRRAQIKIYKRPVPGGAAGLGWQPPIGRIEIDDDAGDWDELGRANVIAHELGHAVGIPHLKDHCSLMWGVGDDRRTPACREGIDPSRLRCGPQVDDVKAAIRRYGGELGDFAGTTCRDTFYYPPTPTPTPTPVVTPTPSPSSPA